MTPKKIALVHDWLFHMRGGEKVLEVIAEIFPNADIYTLFLDSKGISSSLRSHAIKTSWLNWLPGRRDYYRWLLPLMPMAVECFDLKGYDLVISSSHCVAKGVKVPRGVPHICYCHTPMRYIWFFEEEYFSKYNPILRKAAQYFFKKIKKWDLKTSEDVTAFIANSSNIAGKIKKLYGKESLVVHPPLEFKKFKNQAKKEDYYLVVSHLVPYKRVDIAIQAFNRLGKPLWVVGSGPLGGKLRQMAKPNIKFFNWVADNRLEKIYSEAKALVFPGEEDFGIVPLEAQASGTPVIAYAKGGALETVEEGRTGIFFKNQDPEDLEKAVLDFETYKWDPVAIRDYTKAFSKERFQDEFRNIIEKISQ